MIFVTDIDNVAIWTVCFNFYILEMSLSKATPNLENVVTCTICLDDFSDKDPRTLQCLHAFCVRCLDQLNSPKTGYITCPTCTEQTKLPKGSVYDLRHYVVTRQVSNYSNSSLFPNKYAIIKLRQLFKLRSHYHGTSKDLVR